MIPTIRPRKTKIDIDTLLTDEHITYIQQVLEKSCTDMLCVSSEALYEASKLKFSIQIEQHQFKNALSHAIRTKKIVGFETRTGRTGGICREGAFAREDKKISKKTSVSINNIVYEIIMSESKIVDYIKFMGGILSDKGNVIINNKLYSLPKINTIDALIKFLEGK